MRAEAAQVNGARFTAHPEEALDYRVLFEHSLDGVLFAIPDGRILAANPAACQLLGRSEDELRAIGRQGIADAADARWADVVAERTRTGRTRSQVRMRRPGGATFEVELSSVSYSTAAGEPRACIVFRDVSDRQSAVSQEEVLLSADDRIARELHDRVARRVSAAVLQARELLREATDERVRRRLGDLADRLEDTLASVRQAEFRLGAHRERRYQTLVENSPVSVAVYRGADTRFVYANRRAVDLYGARDLEDMLSRYGHEVIPRDLQPGWRHRVQRILEGAVIRQGRTRIVRFDGREIDVEVNAVRVTYDGEPCVQIELRDLTKRTSAERRRRERLEQEARSDPLTGMLNRRGWDTAVAAALTSAAATGTPLTIAVADLDHFKAYNDTYGHPAGDRLLAGLGRRWRTELRVDDTLARLGGEEFGLALPETTAETARQLMERLARVVPDAQTCSAGIAEWTGEETAAVLLARADAALYEAKGTGRNRIVVAGNHRRTGTR